MPPLNRLDVFHSNTQASVPAVTARGVGASEPAVFVVTDGEPTLLGIPVFVASLVTVDNAMYDSQQSNQIPIKIRGTTPISRQPTFASLDALEPCMTKVIVAGISAVLEPSTAASATATSP